MADILEITECLYNLSFKVKFKSKMVHMEWKQQMMPAPGYGVVPYQYFHADECFLLTDSHASICRKLQVCIILEQFQLHIYYQV